MEERIEKLKESMGIKDPNNLTYSAILGKSDVEDWNLFDLPEFNKESSDCKFNENDLKKQENLKFHISRLESREIC